MSWAINEKFSQIFGFRWLGKYFPIVFLLLYLIYTFPIQLNKAVSSAVSQNVMHVHIQGSKITTTTPALLSVVNDPYVQIIIN